MKPDENTELEWMEGTMLVPLKPGPLPILPKALWAEIEEWILAWKHEEALREAELMAPGALLLHGPPGTGKTSLARGILKYMEGRTGAVMESHNVLECKFGESARNLGECFRLAAKHSALLVIEEIDAMGPSRQSTSGSCASEENKITISLMRHLEEAEFPVIATTNFYERIDPALLRRFERQVEVPLLDEKGRAIILKKILGTDASAEMIALPLVVSIRMAHRMRRTALIHELEGRS